MLRLIDWLKFQQKKNFLIKIFSVQHMIFCSISKKPENGCNGNTFEIGWNKLRQTSYNIYAGYSF